jgi:hypothetical protein
MPTWGNTDAANSIPLFAQFREAAPFLYFITANNTVAGNTITLTSNTGFSTIANGSYVYAIEANTGVTANVSRLAKDLSYVDQNDIDFYRSNNVITNANSSPGYSYIQLNNNLAGNLQGGSQIWIATPVTHDATKYENVNDVILVTAGRLANTKGTNGVAGSDTSNTVLGSMNTGWNRITRKINNDGTVRFLKETLVALASPVASNASSANTSSNAIFGGL